MGMVYFVGAGPGSADLITLRGKRLLEKADIVIYAGSLVNLELLDYCSESCKMYDSAKMTLEEVIKVIAEAQSGYGIKGEDKKTGIRTVADDKECEVSRDINDINIVRLHTGDPCIYGAIREQMDMLDSMNIAYEVCPGVSSMCGAAAAMKLEYTLPGVSQSVIITRMENRTSVPEREKIAEWAAHRSTMVIFLSAGILEELEKELIRGGYNEDTPAAIVYKATWPEEKVLLCTVSGLNETAQKYGITKTALIIVGDVVGCKNGYESSYERSRLYDPDFSTEYRRKDSAE